MIRKEISNIRNWSRTKLIIAAVIAVLAIWFIVVNFHSARIRLWLVSVEIPVWMVLVVTFLAGWGFGVLLRRRAARGAGTASGSDAVAGRSTSAASDLSASTGSTAGSAGGSLDDPSGRAGGAAGDLGGTARDAASNLTRRDGS